VVDLLQDMADESVVCAHCTYWRLDGAQCWLAVVTARKFPNLYKVCFNNISMTRKLPVKNDGEIYSSQKTHFYCNKAAYND
jgi:hypothetical protein